MATVRPLEQEDLVRGFRETIGSLRPVADLSDKEMERIFSVIYSNPNHWIFVAVEDNDVVGTITLLIEQKFIHRGGKVGHIEDVAVRQSARRKGVGTLLVETAIRAARHEDCYKAILDCDENNIVFYETLGFKKHGVQMRLDLQ